MSQLGTLIWLKWLLFRNSLRSSKAIVSRIASILGMLAALALALVVAAGLGVGAYLLSSPEIMAQARQQTEAGELPSTQFIFFSIFALSFLIWATLPLSTGSTRQFDPGKLLMYPISLRKLFAVDFISELTSLQSIFAIPAIVAICVGAGLGSGSLALALLAALPIALFGMALSKWLSVSFGSLLRRRRTRGETLIALIGAIAGLGGALVGQLAPTIFKRVESIEGLRWTPPGAAAVALTNGLRAEQLSEYMVAVTTLAAYSTLLVFVTYLIARRSALGLGGAKRRSSPAGAAETAAYTGWELSWLSPQLTAVIEKELRYIMRNAQLRMMVLAPLILIVVRVVNSSRMSDPRGTKGAPSFIADFLYYGEGLIPTGGVLYVFLILTSISCNQFAFEEGGMRALILSPVRRHKILIGKNIALTIIVFFFSVALLAINEIVFDDLTVRSTLFVAINFVTFAAVMLVLGNWLSIRFPKRMKFGKRLNVSGVVGLLLIPMMVLLALPPLVSTAVGYFTGSVAIVYISLTLFALVASCFYWLSIYHQGRMLQRREVEILDAVREPTDD